MRRVDLYLGRPTLLFCSGSKIFDVNVGAQPGVIGQIPAFVVWVFVDDDLIGIPEPAAAEADVVGRDAEVKAAEPEARRASASEVPNVAAAKPTGKAAMFPGMIEVVVRIIAAGVVTYPLIIRVDVGSFRVSGLVAKRRVLGRWMAIAFCGSWTVGGDVTSSNAVRCAPRWMLR